MQGSTMAPFESASPMATRLELGRGHKSRVICEGEDCPETRKVKNLRENPAGHRDFGPSTRWKTAKGLVLKGLDAGGFKRWLWRHGRYGVVGR